MKNYFFLLLVFGLAMMSCQTTVEDKLIGTWTHKSSHSRKLSFEDDPLERVEKSTVTIYYHFYSDGKFKMESEYSEIGTIAEGEWNYDKDYKELSFTKSSLNMTFKVAEVKRGVMKWKGRGGRVIRLFKQ